MTSLSASSTPLSAPLWRCLASGLYECALLFAVMFFSSLLFFVTVSGSPKIQASALQPPQSDIFSIFILLVFASYFGYFWTRSGQTLAMKTWDIRLVNREGLSLTWPIAIIRYLLAWVSPMLLASLLILGLMAVLPPILHAQTALLYPFALILLVALNFVLASLNAEHRFWHDRLLGTRLICTQKGKKSL